MQKRVTPASFYCLGIITGVVNEVGKPSSIIPNLFARANEHQSLTSYTATEDLYNSFGEINMQYCDHAKSNRQLTKANIQCLHDSSFQFQQFSASYKNTTYTNS
jgi:hypothetical protein